MKKISYLFSLLLLSLIGVNAYAQKYSLGEQLSAIPTDGSKVVIQNVGHSKYWNGDADLTSQVGDESLVIFEPTGEEVNGEPTYRFKQVSTGKYIQNVILDGGMDTQDKGGAWIPYTSNPADALVFTAMAAEQNSTDFRKKVTGKFVEGGFVFASTYTYLNNNNLTATYIEAEHVHPYLAPWTGGTEWLVFSVSEAHGAEYIGNAINMFYPNGEPTTDQYSVGTLPGQISQATLDAAKAAFQAAVAAQANPALTDAEAETLVQNLKSTAEALKNTNPVTAGYYYLNDSRATASHAYDNGSKLMIKSGVTHESPATVNDVAYIFQFIPTGEEGKFYIKNFGTSNYVKYTGANTAYATSSDQFAWTVSKSTFSSNTFNIGKTESDGLWNTYTSQGFISQWNQKNDPGDAFVFTPVPESEITALVSQVAQNKLNVALNGIYEKSSVLNSECRVYTCDVPNRTAEGYVTFDEAGLVTDAAQFSSNAKQGNEGSFEGLIDNVAGPKGASGNNWYFHSAWQGAIRENHYLQVNLNDAVQKPLFQFAKRYNANGVNDLQLFRLLATNDTTGTWADEGLYGVNYTQNAIIGSDTLKNGAAMVAPTLSQPYKFFRIVCLNSTGNQQLNGFKFFHIGEFRVYNNAQLDAARSTISQVPAADVAAFETALANARRELNNKAATQATIDALTQAYDKVKAALPDPSTVRSLLNALKTQLTKLPFSDTPSVGFFPTSAKTAAQTVVDEVSTLANNKPNANDWTVAELQAAQAKLAEAKKTLEAKMVLPTAGKIYTIRTATSSTADGRAANAPVYAVNNGFGTGIRYMAPNQSGADSVKVDDHYGYNWLVESVDAANQTVRLKNMGTGRYMDLQNQLNANVTLSDTARDIQLSSAYDVNSGAMNIKVGTDMYLNTGAAGRIVAYNGDIKAGLNNGAFTMAESALSTDGTFVAVTKGKGQIITMPFDIDGFYGNGKAYSFLGLHATGTDTVLAFQEISGTIPAGTPVYYVADANENEVNVGVTLTGGQPTFAFEGKTNNGMIGTVDGTKITKFTSLNFYSATLSPVRASNPEYMRNVGANSGYFSGLAMTTEAGDLQVALPNNVTAQELLNENLSTGIGLVVEGNKANVVYDLQGRRVQNVKSGLYIINGKKVLVK